MPAPLLPIFATTSGWAALVALLRAFVVRFLLVALLYLAFNLVFRIAGSLYLGQGFVQTILNQIITGHTFTLREAFSSLPACATQLFFFMHINVALSMVGATFTAILGLKIFGKALATLGL